MSNNMNYMSDDMLAKHLAGESSDVEKQQLENWLNESAGNKKYYQQFSLLWNESSKLAATSNVDEDRAWERFKERTEQRKQPAPRPLMWIKIAAALVLLAGGTWLSYQHFNNTEQPVLSASTTNTTINTTKEQGDPALIAKEIMADSDAGLNKEIVHKKPAEIANTETRSLLATKTPLPKKENNMNGLYNYYKKEKIVCNGTACPIEICIIQSAKCKNLEDSRISTCNTLEPDESGQLRYKTYDKTLANCTLTIEEIRITRLSTGETITLNDSTPVRASDLFNYMTGKKKGGIVAGIFHTDCNNDSHSHDLVFDNKLGDLLLK